MSENSNEIHIPYNEININNKQLKIMLFVQNALEKGWCIKKRNNEFIFTK